LTKNREGELQQLRGREQKNRDGVRYCLEDIFLGEKGKIREEIKLGGLVKSDASDYLFWGGSSSQVRKGVLLIGDYGPHELSRLL